MVNSNAPTIYGPVPRRLPDDAVWDDFETLTVSNTVKQITAALRANNRAFITTEDETVRFRIDGGDPTSSVGHRLLLNDPLNLHGRVELENFRAIRQDGTDATVSVTVGSRG